MSKWYSVAGDVQRGHRTEDQALARAEQVRASASLGLAGNLDQVLIYEDTKDGLKLRHRVAVTTGSEGVSVRYATQTQSQRSAEFLSTEPSEYQKAP